LQGETLYEKPLGNRSLPMDTYQIITTRRTIRLFDPKPIPSELTERIVNAGRIAPSGANRQVLEFVLIREQEKKKVGRTQV
jgi:nitroreductase